MMNLNDKSNKVTSIMKTSFPVEKAGLYAVFINASCYRGQDLRVEIDNQYFREVPARGNVEKFNVAAAWNGDKLKGLSQMNIFVMNLTAGEHCLEFFFKKHKVRTLYNGEEQWPTDELPNPITFNVQLIGDIFVDDDNIIRNINFDLNYQSPHRDRQPWINLILKSLPVKSLSYDVSLYWREKWDGDDIKIAIDGRIRQANVGHYQWIEQANPVQLNASHANEFITNLDIGDHSIEIWADGQPTIKNLNINLNDKSIKQKLTNNQAAMAKKVFANYDHVKLLDFYVESFSEETHFGLRYPGAGLIIYDPNYDPNSPTLKDDYLVLFWNGTTWAKVNTYGLEHNSEEELDNGVNFAAQQYDQREPLSAGWKAFLIGSTWRFSHPIIWNFDTNWLVFKLK